MSFNGILATARDPDNEPATERGASPARRVAEFLRVGTRPLVAGLLLLPFLLGGIGSGFHPELVALAVIYLVVSEAERRMVLRVGRGHRTAVRVGFRPVYAALVVVVAAFVVHWPWVAPVLLAAMVAHGALWLRGWGTVAITVTAAIANVAASLLCGMVVHDTAHDVYALPVAVLVSLVGFPLLTLVLASRASEVRYGTRALEATVARLRAVRDELQRSQQQLQRWNRELKAEVDRQTSALDERNRYLSIINAVSFALAEPMDDARTLERAVRLVARLLGVRAAQAYTRPRGVEVIDLFVTVAPEDLHAPRLPELFEVARTGRPLSSAQRDADSDTEVPDLGEPYHVVPFVAKGRVLGSFALIGTGTLRDDDDGRHLLLLVGREMGVALENARLYREAIEKASREEFLTEVTRLLNSSGRGERSLPAVLDLLLANTSASEAVLVSLPEGSRDVVVAGSARTGGGESRLESLARSLMGIVVDRGRPLVLGIGGEAPLSDRLAAEGYTTLAIAPILTTRGSLSPEATAHTREHREDAAVRATPSLAGALIVGVANEAEWDGPQTDLLERVTDIVARRVQADEFVAVQQQRIR